MISWELLNDIVENRMKVPLETKLTPVSEQEKAEFAMYEQIKRNIFNIKIDWTNENGLSEAYEQVEKFLKANYPYLSEKSVEQFINYFAYQWR
jgi:hypothetical protein